MIKRAKTVLVIFSLTLISACSPKAITSKAASQHKARICGVNFTGPDRPPLREDKISEVKNSNANWIALIPEANLYRQNLKLDYDRFRQSYGEKTEAIIKAAVEAKSLGFKVMLKPHVVLAYDMSGYRAFRRNYSRRERRKAREDFLAQQEDLTRKASWRGDFAPKNAEDWALWEQQYKAYILKYARLADSLDVEMFCIGTELCCSVKERPQFWIQLIEEIREVYSGKLSYSANWDNYDKITFWDKLDYIGINAYFPLCKTQTPKLAELLRKWKPISRQLEELSKKLSKKIVFTEYGYRNIDYSTLAPWEYKRQDENLNELAQANAYEALYRSFWNKEWFAGGFLWRWEHLAPNNDRSGYSPQGKIALKTVKKWYQAPG